MAPVLSVENLSVSMTNRDGELVPVLEKLSFTIDKGRTIALALFINSNNAIDRLLFPANTRQTNF